MCLLIGSRRDLKACRRRRDPHRHNTRGMTPVGRYWKHRIVDLGIGLRVDVGHVAPVIPVPLMAVSRSLMLLLLGGCQLRSTDVVLASRHTRLAVVAGAEVPYSACAQTSTKEDNSVRTAFEVQWKRMIMEMAGSKTKAYLVKDRTQRILNVCHVTVQKDKRGPLSLSEIKLLGIMQIGTEMSNKSEELFRLSPAELSTRASKPRQSPLSGLT
ncbi:hypothetical protein KC347_g242 [Hortaea werneckii]|nr:hypothetical protein KC347_g242 [Hortaea werneckii]